MRVPNLRFSGFTEEWDKSKLGEIAEIKDSARISNEFWTKEGIPYLRSSDLINNELKGKLFISKETYDKYSSKTGAPQKGDVLFTSGGKVGVVYYKEDNSLVYVQGGAVLYVKTSTSEKLDGSFLSVYFSSHQMKNYMENASVGGTIKHFTLKPANATPIIFPSIREQQKIGSFFKKIDGKIQLQQEKIDLLKEQKKGFMQKIFSQELRFKDKDGQTYSEWHDHILGEIGTTFTGLSGKTKEDFGYGNNSFITYVNVFNNLFAAETGVEKVNVLEGENQALVQKEDILLTTSSETPLEVGMASIWTHDAENLHLNSFCFGYRLHKDSEVLPEFVAISLRSEYMRKKIILLAQGSTRFNMSKTELLEQTIKIPSSIEEQSKIINFYKSLDLKLSLAQQQLENLQQKKQAFMQKIFL